MMALTQESRGKEAQGCSWTADLKGNESTLEQEVKKLQEKLLKKVPTLFEKQIQWGANGRLWKTTKMARTALVTMGKEAGKSPSKTEVTVTEIIKYMTMILKNWLRKENPSKPDAETILLRWARGYTSL